MRPRPALITALLGLTVLTGGCSSDESGTTPSPAKAEASRSQDSLPYIFDPNTGSAEVSKARFGKSWPLTVSDGIVNCIVNGGGGVAAIFQPSASTADRPIRYALNGTAKGSVSMRELGLKPVDPIWADDPATGYKKDISVLIDVCRPYMR
ncbi:MAG: DUF2511 domain-containing protein [Dermatophilaceae bacterium]